MKFSELLGEPEPESELPGTDTEPISVFAPVPASPPPVSTPPEPAPAPVPEALPAPPAPMGARRELTEPPMPSQAAPPSATGGRSGLAELNVRPPIPEAPPEVDSSVLDQLTELDVIVDDLLPSARRGRK